MPIKMFQIDKKNRYFIQHSFMNATGINEFVSYMMEDIYCYH